MLGLRFGVKGRDRVRVGGRDGFGDIVTVRVRVRVRVRVTLGLGLGLG